jgi:hypothetical protein
LSDSGLTKNEAEFWDKEVIADKGHGCSWSNNNRNTLDRQERFVKGVNILILKVQVLGKERETKRDALEEVALYLPHHLKPGEQLISRIPAGYGQAQTRLSMLPDLAMTFIA